MQRKHLLSCAKYHEWAIDNNEPLITPKETVAHDHQRSFADLTGSPRAPESAERHSSSGAGRDGDEGNESGDAPMYRSKLCGPSKREIDARLARGIYRGGYDFDIFEKNEEWKAMFELMGYALPSKELISGRLLDDYYRSLRAKGV
ncbi:MAG: hypothetical protein MMC23_007890 [Stictis urceolatum]|nr:hypothetical protein [Stictis urceolata]